MYSKILFVSLFAICSIHSKNVNAKENFDSSLNDLRSEIDSIKDSISNLENAVTALLSDVHDVLIKLDVCIGKETNVSSPEQDKKGKAVH